MVDDSTRIKLMPKFGPAESELCDSNGVVWLVEVLRQDKLRHAGPQCRRHCSNAAVMDDDRRMREQRRKRGPFKNVYPIGHALRQRGSIGVKTAQQDRPRAQLNSALISKPDEVAIDMRILH
jgi:hypothetical protein